MLTTELQKISPNHLATASTALSPFRPFALSWLSRINLHGASSSGGQAAWDFWRPLLPCCPSFTLRARRLRDSTCSTHVWAQNLQMLKSGNWQHPKTIAQRSQYCDGTRPRSGRTTHAEGTSGSKKGMTVRGLGTRGRGSGHTAPDALCLQHPYSQFSTGLGSLRDSGDSGRPGILGL